MEATMSSTEDTNKLQAKEAYWDIGLTEVEGFWYSSRIISSIEAFRAKFKPKREDEVVILASNPKTGTTWLKALSHCILFRDEEDDLLIKMNPHLCVPYLDARSSPVDPVYFSFVLDKEQGRLFNTHLSYSYLPDSIKNDCCKLVYMARDPKDTLVSMWHFYNKILRPFPLERAVESFCSGMVAYGPFYEHVLEYWEQSNRSPDKVMFIKFEDLHYDPKPHVRKLAAFLKPFGEGDDDAQVENVIWRSSFDRLKDLDVNKTGKSFPAVNPHLTNDLFFRRGEVGHWRNHLMPEVAKRFDDITRMKFQSCGLYLHEEEAI
ncbi:Cytosolic sulfotransferase 5 [Linum perenne]